MTSPSSQTQSENQTAPHNECGTCTTCCRIMKVKELDKGANQACVHCVEGSGCTIYAERPESCRVYECLWLRSQKFEKPFGPQLRPDRCHVVIGTMNNGNEAILYVDPAHRNAWKEPGFSEALGLFCTRGIPVHVSCNDVVERVY